MRNRYSLRYCIFTLVVLVLPTTPAWADLMLTSTVQRTAVLELYTSEGCSSCPPADRWLHQFTTDARLWRDIVPLAFHVDYWDYLGWRDRFAHPEHTARQQTYAAIGGIKTVYTPGLVLNGREWRGWFERRTLPIPPAAAVGVLTGVARF
ncbi:MAG: hypothetical protein FD130_2142 [Halothiobacillaceae bacterium]|nr:MAG: hypothetical protein FD130_2142 [Halothiobacillaceae bacterium]